MKLTVICPQDSKTKAKSKKKAPKHPFTYDDLLVGLASNDIEPESIRELILIAKHPLNNLLNDLIKIYGLNYDTVTKLDEATKKASKILVLHKYKTSVKDYKQLVPKAHVKKVINYEVGSLSYVTNMLWVPKAHIDEDQLATSFDRRMYDDTKCQKCPFLESRHDPDNCDPCGAYQGRIIAYQNKTIGGRKFIGLPIGAKLDIKKVLHNYPASYKQVVDARPVVRVAKDMEFHGTLRPYQKKAVKALTATPSSGILRSAPRTGKTIMSMALICNNGLKTIFMAGQGDWLKQAHKEAKNFTRLVKENRIGYCKKLADFDKYDVCLVTYQTFLSVKGQELLEKIRHKFGLLVVDEVHMSAAPKFSSIVNSFNAKWKFGLTAEVERKDQRHWLCYSIFGPVKFETEVETLKPLVQLEEMPCVPPTPYKRWDAAMNWMATDAARNKIIFKQIIKDVKAGRHLVVPVVRVSHAIALADAINRVMPGTAMAFHGKSNRPAILKAAIEGDIKVVTGIRSILSTGINVPKWDTLYVVIPQSNPPKQYQELSRIATPMPGKPTPIIRHWISKWGAEIGCLRTCMQVYRKHCTISRSTEMVYRNLTDNRPGYGKQGQYKRANPFA